MVWPTLGSRTAKEENRKPAFHLGSASVALSSTGLSPTRHLAPCIYIYIRCNNTLHLVLVYLLLWCSPRLHSRSSTFYHVHYPLNTLNMLYPFPEPPSLRRRYPTFSLYPPNFDSSITHLENALLQISSWLTANLLTLNSSRAEFLLIGLKKQLDNIHNSSLNTTHSARNLRFIFWQSSYFLLDSYQILAISKAYYYRMRQLHCIRPYLDSTTACTTATSIVHSKLDYCNSLYYNLTESQITRLQQVQNSLAHAVAPKSCHITPILCSLHWLQITEHIEYKLLSLTYKVLTATQSPYLHNLISVQPPRSTQSSSLITLARQPTSSSWHMTDCSFRYASPCLWNQLPSFFRQPHSSPSVPDLPVHDPTTSSHSVNSPLSPSITPSRFHIRLKTYLFHKSFPPQDSLLASGLTARTL